MSVNYKAGIAQGWIFNETERKRFNRATDYKYEDDFIFPNDWDGTGDTIFGEWVAINNEPGTMIEISVLDLTPKEPMRILDWIKKYEEAGYDGADLTPPKYYLVNQVW